ncbi:MAG: TonB-dependent receptor plug domain-containing protein [Saprospiraceae bacterium]|nr:TonB-dependent receptor plug domain-containing protein [Saprospiraceae bacterium]NNK89132.1 TonB-dependent receptor plug domain-containing protein [Saprospiraceae bacterium]
MLKNFTLFILCFFFSGLAISQTSLQGKITEEGTGEAVLFATIALYKNDVLLTGTESDFDGNYFFSDIDPGTYDIEVSFLGLQTQRIAGIVAKAGKVNVADVSMKEEGVLVDVIEIVDYQVPLVEFDNTTQGKSLTSENIQALPTKNIGAIAATTAGVSLGNDGNISVRGSRTDATYYYIDGVRVSSASVGNQVPQQQIDQMQVITGGIEAKYGDVTGGIISITTKGPSQNFTGGIEAETSEFLDSYGYNLLNANFSGPILKNKEGESIVGFRAFGQYSKIKEDGPSAVGYYRAPRSLINQLEESPITSFNGTDFPSAEFVTSEDIPEPVEARENQTDEDYNVSLKLDSRFSQNIDFTVSGTVFDSKNVFAPSGSWALYNWTNNPIAYRSGYRGNVRLRHKLGNQSFGGDEEKKNSIIRNASYTLQFGYEKNKTKREDITHEDNIFRYGYYGSIARDWNPVASILTDPDNWGGEIQFVNLGFPVPFAHQGYALQEGEFTASETINPVLAKYNPLNGFQEVALNQVWNLYNNVGQVYNLNSKSEAETYTINVTSGFDLFPGGSDSGKHSIQFGFMYEQRIQRSWGLNPRRIWELMRTQANRHLNGVDTSNIVGTFVDEALQLEFTQYGVGNSSAEFADNAFFRELRESQGVPIDQYINTDGLNPDDLRLDMFSASELNNFSNIGLNYFGYDYLGNKIDNSVTFDDFFTSKDSEGRRNFLVAPWQPIYGAAYIQDKFTFKDIIFRLGLRVDYYDANSKVLKDPYSFSEIQTARQFFADNPGDRPSSVGDDYRVYVSGEGSDDVIGYRLEDEWFKPDGTATDGNLLFGGGLVFPAYVEEDFERRNPQFYRVDEDGVEETFNTDLSFKDYDPQLNFMPRLAFSFPISQDAGFFAHYDILVQRPPSNVISTPLDYFYFFDVSRFSPAGNPDLKPEKTIDYEVGFQQKISNASAMKISAYYKEMRDMIQARIFSFIPDGVSQYETYGNLDFGTVKGFAFSYDLRRTGNFQLNATYTLQFADGSGSNANSGRGINQRGNIRTLLPLSFDERHRITAVADYRYSSGKNYNGPRLAGKDIFANAGLNLFMTAVSGRPYSTFQTVTQPGGASGRKTINGARLPWTFNADLQLDKNFQIKFSEESKRYLGINVYLRVQNLFDLDNVVGVYNVSGDPDSDGYLLGEFGEERVAQIVDAGLSLDSFLSTYNWFLLAPGNYTRPRQIFLGAIVNF